MLTLCLPAAGIQEDEAVAIGGGLWEWGLWEEEDNKPSLHQRLLFGHINLVSLNGPLYYFPITGTVGLMHDGRTPAVGTSDS
jgi:hypothetical protein